MQSFAPLVKEDDLSADQYFNFVTATLDVYNKTNQTINLILRSKI